MFIRRTQTRNTATGERYFTHRLVRSERTADGKVRQITLLNLGRHFAVEQEHWPLLCARMEQLLSGEPMLLPVECPPAVEKAAQRYVAQYLAQRGEAVATPAADKTADVQAVDVDSLQLVRPRSVGVEQLGLWAMEQVGFIPLLERLGLNGPQQAAVLGLVMGRMAAPGSERATYGWLCERSGLGELLDVDFEAMPLQRLYRASDLLMRHRAAIEHHLFSTITDLFGLSTTVTLFDLTNTYFEGESPGNPKAKRGHSKEKRSDCPLVTLGLVLDGSGFVRRSEVFEGSVTESRTLAPMLQGLGAPNGALVVMDAGIATEANLLWLRENGYRYLVVSRERGRQFDPDQAVSLTTAAGQTVQLQKVLSEDEQEVRLYCHSEERAHKEQGISERFVKRFEAGLQKLADGLQKPRGMKNVDKLWERIGRLKESSRGVGQHYRIDITPDEHGNATALTWEQLPVNGSQLTHPGVYCLRSSETDWAPERLWQTYVMLTDLEAVFRSLKSELGLRPVYHHTENRVDGHLFITVIAYQMVQIIRRRLKEHSITLRWRSLRERMAGQCRITAIFQRQDGGALHVRKPTRAEPAQLEIYRALGANPAPGGITKMLA